MIEVGKNLQKFAKLTDKAGYKTYLVGGYVRNSLLGFATNDVDISCAMPVDDVVALCEKNGFTVQPINKRLGTLLITKDDERYEYTTFREELYDNSGKHSPDEVSFVTDPKIDASRRDFTVNALYYDIVEEKLLDFFNGEQDLKKKVLKTVVDPNKVFADDGLRILRLIRFCSELNFKIDGKTLKTATRMAYKVADISRERILTEIKTSINGALKYQLKNNTHANVIKYYNKLKLWQYMLNGNFKNFKVNESGKLYNAYLKSDGSNRYVAFMCLVLNNYIKVNTSESNLGFSVNQILGANGLKESNKNIQEIFDAYKFVQYLLYLKEEQLLDSSICLQFENLPFEIKNYLSLVNAERVNKLKLEIMHMKKRKVPFKQDDLNITNKELIDVVKVKTNCVSKIKETLFEMCVKGMVVNDHDILMEQAKFLNEKLERILAEQLKAEYEKKQQLKKESESAKNEVKD